MFYQVKHDKCKAVFYFSHTNHTLKYHVVTDIKITTCEIEIQDLQVTPALEHTFYQGRHLPRGYVYIHNIEGCFMIFKQ